MTKKPFVNALAALGYIILVVLVMSYAAQRGGPDKPDNILIPVAMLSLLTLSAATMGYIFVFYPVQMYLDGDKKGGINLFVKTLGYFAVFTVVAVLAMLFVPSLIK